MSSLLRVLVVAVPLSFLAVGCSTRQLTSVPGEARQKLLPFLQDGTTKKEEIISRLGKPSSQFQKGRILTYKLRGEKAVSSSTWGGVEYNLILVFDGDGILKKHSLLTF